MGECLYIDIETIPGEKQPSKDDLKVPASYKKEESIQEWLDDPVNLEVVWRKQSLLSYRGRILCLAYAINEGKPVVLKGTEKEILQSFDRVIKNMVMRYLIKVTANDDVLIGLSDAKIQEKYFSDKATPIMIGHNVKGFDHKWIIHRAYKYKCKWIMKCYANLPRWSDAVQDTMLMWGSLDWQDKTSLDNIALFFGYDGKNDMKGSEVFDYWQAGKLDEIYQYCAKDVKIVRNIYKRMI